MVSARRIGSENSETRTQLLDAAQQLMREDGYAAVSARKVAAKAGLKPQLVLYYFRTMDDLFLAMLQRMSDAFLVQFTRGLTSSTPLKAIWELSSDPRAAGLVAEFMALANHRKAIRTEISRFGKRLRSIQIEVLTRALEQHGMDTREFPPGGIAVLIESLARVLALNASIGNSEGHAEAVSLVYRFIERFELQPAKAVPAKSTTARSTPKSAPGKKRKA